PQVKTPARLPDYDVGEQRKKPNFWKSFTAWQVTFFMGLQSLMYYTLLTWLPDILLLHGYSTNKAGWMLSLMQFSLIPFTFIVPIVAGKMKNQMVLSAFTGISFILGVFGLLNGSTV